MKRVHWGLIMCALAAVVASGLCGCKSSPAQKANENFFTSGSREADQRASQRMAQSEQLTGSGEGAGEKNVKKAVVKKADPNIPTPTGATNQPAQATEKLSLFERLGGEVGVSNIISDFTV